MKEKHVKLRVSHSSENGKQPRAFDALGWRMAEQLQQFPLVIGDVIDIAFKVDENHHPDFGGLQLVMCDYARALEETTNAAQAVTATSH
jgi:single-stranded-DNA-specific exonuclease